MPLNLTVNGQPHTLDLEPEMPLLWVLREVLGITGPKYGCGMALCGACTVHLDGAPIRSCITPIAAAAGKKVNTIESMEGDNVGRAVQKAWVELNVAQCGYCQAGQIMSATSLLRTNRAPSDEDIVDAMSGNICRCGTYHRIHAAINRAAGDLGGKGAKS